MANSTQAGWTRRAVLRALPQRAARLWGRAQPRFDPFVTIELQIALGRVEAMLAQVQANPPDFAQGHHLFATAMAYETLLRQACAVAQVPSPTLAEVDADPNPLVRRMRYEIELRSRGWTW